MMVEHDVNANANVNGVSMVGGGGQSDYCDNVGSASVFLIS